VPEDLDGGLTRITAEKVLRRANVLGAKGSLYTILDTDFGERLYFYELR
jgi:hypothetical protein